MCPEPVPSGVTAESAPDYCLCLPKSLEICSIVIYKTKQSPLFLNPTFKNPKDLLRPVTHSGQALLRRMAFPKRDLKASYLSRQES